MTSVAIASATAQQWKLVMQLLEEAILFRPPQRDGGSMWVTMTPRVVPFCDVG